MSLHSITNPASMYSDDHKGVVSVDLSSSKGFDEKEKTIVTIRPVSSDSSVPNPTGTPLDSGRAAYGVLLACFLIQAVTSGFPLAYGVFEEYYSTKYTNFEIASWIGVLNEGIPYLGAPLMTICCEKFQLPRQVYVIVGIALCVASHIASAFMTNLSGLILTQGCLFGVGSLLTEIPSLVILDTHFDKRRGMAYGVVLGGADIAGIVYAFLSAWLLRTFSYRVSMTVFAIITGVIAAIAMWPLRERTVPSTELSVSSGRRGSFIPGPLMRARPLVPPTHLHTYSYNFRSEEHKFEGKYYKQTIFYILNAANIILAISESLPWIYLPTFATELGHNSNTGAVILAVGMISMLVGEIACGSLSDMFDVKLLIIATMLISTLSTFILWGVLGSKSLGTLIAYSCIFSSSSGGFLALWARMGTTFGEENSTMVYSILSMGKGAGVILSGPISQALLLRPSRVRLGGQHSDRWGAMIAYVGGCSGMSAVMGFVGILVTISRRRTVDYV